MMLDSIRKFFRDSMVPDAEPTVEDHGDDLQLAACALMLELAYADSEFTEDERRHVEAAVRRHFGVDREQARRLLELAEEEWSRAVDLFQFTRLIAEHYTLGQKMVLVEILWGLVYSDGDLARHEDYLMRKIVHLLGLEPGYLAQARNRVRAREGMDALD